MEVFLQQLINGITLGSIYGLIAIGYTMVFGIIGMVNFAHGDVFMVVDLRCPDRRADPDQLVRRRRRSSVVLFIVLIVAMLVTSLLELGHRAPSPIGRCAARSVWRR